jgi:hypothetical protein
MPWQRRPQFVRCRIVDEYNRVACALHTSLDYDFLDEEPLWVMIPIDKEVARRLEAVVGITLDGKYLVQDISEDDRDSV